MEVSTALSLLPPLPDSPISAKIREEHDEFFAPHENGSKEEATVVEPVVAPEGAEARQDDTEIPIDMSGGVIEVAKNEDTFSPSVPQPESAVVESPRGETSGEISAEGGPLVEDDGKEPKRNAAEELAWVRLRRISAESVIFKTIISSAARRRASKRKALEGRLAAAEQCIEETEGQLDKARQERDIARHGFDEICSEHEEVRRSLEEDVSRRREESQRDIDEANRERAESCRERDEARRKREEALREVAELRRERDEARRERDEAVAAAAEAAAAAAATPPVAADPGEAEALLEEARAEAAEQRAARTAADRDAARQRWAAEARAREVDHLKTE
ncbi:unnamed protein product, partial [Phaeothamnion confervicola]